MPTTLGYATPQHPASTDYTDPPTTPITLTSFFTNMNCLEFQRALRIEPNARDARLLEHAASCAVCEASFRRARAFEAKLHGAVNIEPPENMVARVVLAQTIENGRATTDDADTRPVGRRAEDRRWWRRAWRGRWKTIAASVALIAITAGIATERSTRDSRLGGELIDMVERATYAMMAKGPVLAPEIEAALGPIGLGMNGELERKVRFAGQCRLRGRQAGHLVVEGSRAPISIFVMPGQRLSGRSDIENEHWSGVLIPAPGGSIAIIAAPGEPIEALEARLQDLVRWQA
ncbi:MAG: DUF3379 family protein [Gammaproteobacteria bacterium]